MKRDVDIVGILEWASKQQREAPKPPQRGYRDYRREKNPLDKLFADFIEEHLRNKFREMDEKLNKKEEKKEEKKSWWDQQSFFQKLAVLTVTVPFGMMTLIISCLAFAKIVKNFF